MINDRFYSTCPKTPLEKTTIRLDSDLVENIKFLTDKLNITVEEWLIFCLKDLASDVITFDEFKSLSLEDIKKQRRIILENSIPVAFIEPIK